MDKFTQLSKENREAVIIDVAQQRGISEGIIEKDFWVSFVLEYLYEKSEFSNKLAFKGGTSLSKVYSVIDRFSEDIDIVLHWDLVNIDFNEPWNERSNTKQKEYVLSMDKNSRNFIEDTLLEFLRENFDKVIAEDYSLSLEKDNSISFFYPKSFTENAILPKIRLEIGPVAAWTPVRKYKIRPIISKYYPDLFNKIEIEVLTTKINRTFWEKITIIHKEANRNNGHFSSRYSRHYYDVYMIYNSNEFLNIIKSLELLKKVIKFNNKFFYSAFANYDEILEGKFKIQPNNNYLIELKKDYVDMQNMIYDQDAPSFDDIMNSLATMKDKLNLTIISNT